MALIDPVAFAFASGGQTAAVGVVNQPAAGHSGPPPPGPVAASPVAYTDPPACTPTEQAGAYQPSAAVEEPAAIPAEQVGGAVVRVIRPPVTRCACWPATRCRRSR